MDWHHVTTLVLIAGSISTVLYAKNAQKEAARRQARTLHGRIRNRSTHTLNSITLRVQFYEKDGSPDILGDKTVRIQVNVPAHQTREISWPISFEGAPQLTEYAWKYAITEIRGGQKWVDNFLDD
jgi:hypothetical protein